MILVGKYLKLKSKIGSFVPSHLSFSFYSTGWVIYTPVLTALKSRKSKIKVLADFMNHKW